MPTKITPERLRLHRKSKRLEIEFDRQTFQLSAEYLRVHSPSAEVRGHGPGQATLQHGKALVGIKQLEPSGNYAARIIFDDGHDSGIYTWEYLYDLCKNHDSYWQQYLARLEAAGHSRDSDVQVIKFTP